MAFALPLVAAIARRKRIANLAVGREEVSCPHFLVMFKRGWLGIACCVIATVSTSGIPCVLPRGWRMGDTSPAMINDSNAMVVPLDSATDDELVAAAKANDERAFELLVKRYQPKLLAIVLRYVRVREDAEDVVQQTFQSAFIHLHRFESKSAISSWLTRIAINEALMLLRKRRTRWELSIGSSTDHELSSLGFDLSDSRFDPEANYLGREKRDMLSAAIAKLGPRLRLAIELRELQELSTQDTARSMGVSVAAVKARVFNGRKKLQGAFRGFEMSLNAQKSYSS